MISLKKLCDLPIVNGTINVIQIHIFKSMGPFAIEYFSYKLNTYVMQFYLVIECRKQLKMFSLGCSNQ
jgi:hypothetical protein